MRTAIFIPILMLLMAGSAFTQVSGTFKIMGNGLDTYGLDLIREPKMSLWGGTGSFTAEAPPVYPTLGLSSDYTVKVLDDRITLGTLCKHHHWDDDVAKHFIQHDFTTDAQPGSLIKAAHFNSVASVQIFNNFEESADDGSLMFRDPWYVDGNGNQPDDLLPFPSPYIPTGNSNFTDPSDAAVFLNQLVTSGRPFYSVEFPTFLDWDRSTTVNPPLTQGDWSLVKVYAREAEDHSLSPFSQSAY